MKFKKINGGQNHHLFYPYSKLVVDDVVSYELRDVIWLRFYRVGKGRLEESLKTNILSEARLRRDERIAKFLGERPRYRGKVFLVEEKFEEFLDLKKGKAKKTQVSMRLQWEKHLKPHFGGLILDEVNETEWIKYVHAKRALSPNRKFFNDRKYLSMFLNWLHRTGLISTLPKLEDVDPERAAGKVYSDDEISRLLSWASTDMYLQILMALTMFMRKSEILTMEWSQVDLQKRVIHLPAHKTKIRKARSFGISDAVHGLLEGRKSKSTSPFIFPSPHDESKHVTIDGNQTSWDTCRERSEVSGRFHDLRHTALTRAFKNHAHQAALICTFAGLSLEEASRTYLHFDTEDTRIVASLVGVKA